MMILFYLSLALSLVCINDNLFAQNMVEFGQSYPSLVGINNNLFTKNMVDFGQSYPLQYDFLVVSYMHAIYRQFNIYHQKLQFIDLTIK